ncbi:MAG: S8 family serine peptidase [Saprospiraceae bacterium]
MIKLPAELRSLIKKRQQAAGRRQSGLESTSKSAETPAPPAEVGIQLEFRDSLDPLIALGLKITSREGNFAGGIIAIDNLEALAAHPNIVRIEKPPREKKRLDKSIPDIRANQVWSRSGDTWNGMTGREVIIGVVDTGIDFVHKTFRKADNSTRILSIWDQTVTADAAKNEAAPGTISTPGGDIDLDYGVEYVREDAGNPARPTIKKALENSNPYSIVRHKDRDGHGTHVAGIAAGDGSQSDACCGDYTYVGVAPEADLIIVRKLGLTEGDPDSANTSNSKIDAIRYILSRANGRPCVINLSLGRDIGPRDGSAITEQRIDSILSSFPQKVAIIQSSGNEADEVMHMEGTVPDHDTESVIFKVKKSIDVIVKVELLYDGNHLEAAVKPPGETFDEADWDWVGPGDSVDDLGYNGDGEVAIDNENGKIRVTLTPPDDGNNVSGKWTLRLRNNTGDDTDVHLWCDAEIEFRDPEDDDAGIHITSNSTVNPEGTAKNVIVVGAYATEGGRKGKLADFSSRGPALDTTATAEENIRPHIAAPGVAITSAATDKYRSDEIGDYICCCDCCQDFYISFDGTSQATPHVTGTVALMLQKNDQLGWEEIRELLKDSARDQVPADIELEDGEDALPNNNWGWGKLDVKQVVEDTPDAPGAPRTPAAPPADPAFAVHFNGPVEDMRSLRKEFQSLPGSRFYQDLVASHFHEVRNLINTNKRVATVWHRNGGPALIRMGMQAAFQPDKPLPVEWEGVPISERIERISAIIKRYGSGQLIRDLDEHIQGWFWVLREGFSVRQLLGVFREQAEKPATVPA